MKNESKPEISNKHVTYLLKKYEITLGFYALLEKLCRTCIESVSVLHEENKPGFNFSIDGHPLLNGRVNQSFSKRFSVLKEFLTHEKLNVRSGKHGDDRVMFCAAVLLIAIGDIRSKDGRDQSESEIIELFRGKSFEQKVGLLKGNLTMQFSEELYASRDIVSIFTNSGSIVSELKPWGCSICYYTKASDEEKLFNEEIVVRNILELKNDLHDAIITFGRSHPLIRLFLKEENIDEQLSLLYSGIKIKKLSFRLNETVDGFDYEPKTVHIDDAYVSKIIHGIYNRIHKEITTYGAGSERAPIDLENDLAQFAFSEAMGEGRPSCDLNPKLIRLFEEKGVLTTKDNSVRFANSYLRWIFLALYLCRNLFNKDRLFTPDEKGKSHFRYVSLYENIFLCVKYFLARCETASNEDALIFGTVFGTALVSFLNKVRRQEFMLYLCELAKEYACRFRPDQELAISILCTALNECLDSLEEKVRNEAFKCCYSKTNYRIQQESFKLLKPASLYFMKEIERNFSAYVRTGGGSSPIKAQPYYFFYYHHLFKEEFLKTSEALDREWDGFRPSGVDGLLGTALAIRELSWRNHNGIQFFKHMENFDRIIKSCIPLIPFEKDVPDYSEKRKIALAVESIAFTIANLRVQLSGFGRGDDGESDELPVRFVRLMTEYDLFMRRNNTVYHYYLENPVFTDIESVPDGLLVCGMIRAFSFRQRDLPKSRAASEWRDMFEKERGRFKVLIARALAHTDFFDKEENRALLAGIADDLTKQDFLAYDNIDLQLVYRHPFDPLEWYV